MQLSMFLVKWNREMFVSDLPFALIFLADSGDAHPHLHCRMDFRSHEAK